MDSSTAPECVCALTRVDLETWIFRQFYFEFVNKVGHCTRWRVEGGRRNCNRSCWMVNREFLINKTVQLSRSNSSRTQSFVKHLPNPPVGCQSSHIARAIQSPWLSENRNAIMLLLLFYFFCMKSNQNLSPVEFFSESSNPTCIVAHREQSSSLHYCCELCASALWYSEMNNQSNIMNGHDDSTCWSFQWNVINST